MSETSAATAEGRSLFGKLFGFWMPSKDAPRIEDSATVDQMMRFHRRTMIVTLIVLYGAAYTCRLGLNVIKKPLIDNGIFDAVELGWIGAGFYWGYALGKLLNGLLADRVNVRSFLATGLAVSAVVNLAMGFNTLALAAVVLWALNGWFQGFLAPTSVVSLTQWYAPSERGTMYGVWSSAHSIGEGLTFLGTATLVAATSWQAGFWGPGLFCLIVAGTAYVFLRERPQTIGLPSVAEWKGEVPPASKPDGRSLLKTQLSLLAMPAIWVIGLASLSMYVTRYAVNSWGILYLQEAHGLSTEMAGFLIGINTIAGIFGCIAYGVISDRLFGSRRPPVTLIFGLVEIGSLFLIFFAPDGNTAIIGLGFVLYGFTLSGILAVLGGLFAVDIAPRNATGAAMGIIGVFGYVGAGLQDVISGWLIDRGTTVIDHANGIKTYDFSAPVTLWIGASIVSAILATTLWKVKSSD